MTGIDCHGRKDGKCTAREEIVDYLALPFVQIFFCEDRNVLLGHRRENRLIETAVLLVNQLLCALRNSEQLGQRSETFGWDVLCRNSSKDLFANSRNSHHEEFIQVGAEYCQKL